MVYKDWENKLQAIESYLQSLFRECIIEKVEDPLRSQLFRKYFFRIKDHGGEIEHRFSVDYYFLNHNTSDAIIEYFEKQHLRKLLEEAGRNEVMMTTDGIRVVPRKKG